MRANLTLFKFVVKPITGWAAHRALVGRNRVRGEAEKGRFTAADVSRLLGQSWRAFDALVPDVAREPTVGSRLNLQLAALSLALYRHLLAAGIEQRYAIELIGDTCWQVYQYWGRIGLLLTRLSRHDRIKDHVRRIRPDGSWPMSFPFNPPGYRARYVAVPGGLGFDVIRCPVAEYFRSRGAPDLAVGTWCMLDYPLAEMLNLKLARGQTLAAGDARCDFRWFAAAEAQPGKPPLVKAHRP